MVTLLRSVTNLFSSLFCTLLILAISWMGLVPVAIALPITPLSTLSGQILSLHGNRPATLGVNQTGHLAACPPSPNCVSSESADPAHAIDPLTFTGEPEAAFAALKQTIAAFPRHEVITETEDYLYVEFTSHWLGFVDDVEFYLDRAAHKIQVRSASRLGESDLGVNRQRVEAIRSAA